MNVESNDAIAIAVLGDWLKILVTVSQPMISKTENQAHLVGVIFPAL